MTEASGRKRRRLLGSAGSALALMAVFIALGGTAAVAQEAPGLEALKRQLEEARDQIRRQQEIIEGIQAKILEMEARKEAAPSREQAEAASARIEWRNGTWFTFERARFVWANRVQVRWMDGTAENAPALRRDGTFRIQRFKTKIEGWAYEPWIRFKFQADWAKSGSLLDDAYVDVDLSRGRGYFRVRFGQFKIPFSRQHMGSTQSNMFPERSFVTYAFARVRDVGIQLHGEIGPRSVPDLVEWRVSLLNGNSANVWSNPDGNYMTTARVVISPFGSAGYDESTPAGSETAKLSLAAGYAKNDLRLRDGEGNVRAGFKHETLGADLLFKWRRFTLYGEYFDRKLWNAAHLRRDSDGYVAQAGYLLVPNRVEVVGRAAGWDPDDAFRSDSMWERGVGLNWYFDSTCSKLQFDYRWTRNLYRLHGESARDDEIRLQYQLVF